ncbi:hypothetical protein NDU88_006687 [Pleurodeles waltl]|uniref:Uncharacterized protein n=1 Tax=Pleurodeles waltl TaxID=8319 RepID=A0AAV7TXH5_PLEWA|nr:hypothetical protein NDU88_006687 [Pleurodeles waltl]
MTAGKEASKTPSPRRSIRGELKGIRGTKYRIPIVPMKETHRTEREKETSGDTSHAPGLPQVQNRVGDSIGPLSGKLGLGWAFLGHFICPLGGRGGNRECAGARGFLGVLVKARRRRAEDSAVGTGRSRAPGCALCGRGGVSLPGRKIDNLARYRRGSLFLASGPQKAARCASCHARGLETASGSAGGRKAPTPHQFKHKYWF